MTSSDEMSAYKRKDIFFKTWLKHTNNQRMLNGQYTPQWTVVCKKYTNYLIVTKIQLQKCILLMFDG